MANVSSKEVCNATESGIMCMHAVFKTDKWACDLQYSSKGDYLKLFSV